MDGYDASGAMLDARAPGVDASLPPGGSQERGQGAGRRVAEVGKAPVIT